MSLSQSASWGCTISCVSLIFFFQAEDGIRDGHVTGVQTCALPISFARECGLTTIKLKNFRSKWVGATEGNLEKILNVIRALGQVVVIVDEGDRAFGNKIGRASCRERCRSGGATYD